jgi:N-formylglutamate amidohydrolase
VNKLIRSTYGNRPVVITMPQHAPECPADFRYACKIEALWAEERVVSAEVLGVIRELNCNVIEAWFPRTYIDLERRSVEIDQELLFETWPYPIEGSARVLAGQGLIWRNLSTGEPIYRRKLSVQEAKNRLEQYWVPYHRTLEFMISQVVDKFGSCLHLHIVESKAEFQEGKEAEFKIVKNLTNCKANLQRVDLQIENSVGFACTLEPRMNAIVENLIDSFRSVESLPCS